MKQKHSISLHRKTFEIPHTVLIFNLEGHDKEQAIKNKCILLGFYIELKTLKKDTQILIFTVVHSCPRKCYKQVGLPNMNNQVIFTSDTFFEPSSSCIQMNLDEGQY